jgi:carboxypeptidase Q
MKYAKLFSVTTALLIYFALPLSAADKSKTNANSSESNKPSYELPQPAKENLDLNMYQQIRIEGLTHSHVMDYASGLMDGIGPRLTGSPNVKRANEWTRDQLAAMGLQQCASRRLG